MEKAKNSQGSKDSSPDKNTVEWVKFMISRALKENKIEKSDIAFYTQSGHNDPLSLDEHLSSIRPGEALLKKITATDYNTLFSSGELATIQKYDSKLFSEIYFKKFGKYPEEKKQ